MNSPNILIVEDDNNLNCQLSELLSGKGYSTEQCFDGEEGLLRAVSGNHQLILLDVMLPKRDGFSFMDILREYCQTPVIMLTACGAEEERIRGFNHGVDDYLAKPFNTTELILRIEALLRRCSGDANPKSRDELCLDGLTLSRNGQLVTVDGSELELTQAQFNLLWSLMLHKGQVLSKPYLYQIVLKRSFGAHDRSLDMHLSRLRRKLDNAGWCGDRLSSVQGQGYYLS